ncbi:hypothetical protein M501DRAFT_1012279 [Patellaria atrata CBS 101060]|uniref:RING-type domain-containing protein n=1 Tax=Patellaria atrata CBS 101060 TaxID=1346257 RepID=A0A9P4VTA1_9PEZI|nr:hypothetical protein M501DRAFT_1012279 [Patellaria atrata CBS 101060]
MSAMDTRASSAPATTSRNVRQKPTSTSASSSTVMPSNATSRPPQVIRPSPSASSSAPRSTTGSTTSTHKPPTQSSIEIRKARTSSKDSLTAKMPKKQDEVVKPDKNEEVLDHQSLLKVYKSSFDSLRSLITCKICDRLLYEPYVISCGHVYCYSCLCQWFVTNKKKKTCPDCRAHIIDPPAPSYLTREITQNLIARAELLPPGESAEQHTTWHKEEQDQIQQDKNNTDKRTGGLFKGVFRNTRKLRVFVDEEDTVDRCPYCMWELVDRECSQCGLQVDENGSVIFPNSFGGFSDMDETSEHNMSGEDHDAELDMEDDDAELGFEEDGMEEWGNYHEDDHPYAVRRWLANGALGAPPHTYASAPRRRAAHSAAGSRRRSYSASIISDIFTEDAEMETLEEEDDEDLEDEDSSMNDFIDDEVEEQSQSTNSTSGQTLQPSFNVNQRRARRVVESDSSSVSHIQDLEEDDEDEGPIPNGRRRQNPGATTARFGHRGTVPPSESTEASIDQELSDDEQALLYENAWAQLGNDGQDDEMDDGEGDDSDGGRTTIGWEPTANSNDTSRIPGSLTPVAGRPPASNPHAPRIGSSRFLDGSRGLRRRSSVLSVSTVNYEDGEADDDDSEAEQGIDHDGDMNMNGLQIRARRSRIRLRNGQTPNVGRPESRILSVGDAVDVDTDDNSDTSAYPSRRRQRMHSRQPDYDPRISWMFTQHLNDMREIGQVPGGINEYLEQLRAVTPVSRPRTANRNRFTYSPAPFSPLSNGSLPPFSPPANAPTRHRTPSIDGSSVGGRLTEASSRQSRSSSTSVQSSSTISGVPVQNTSVGQQRDSSTVLDSTATASQLSNSIQAASTGTNSLPIDAMGDIIERPMSRVSSRPPSAAGRRPAPPFGPAYSGLSINPGLNFAARSFQAGTRNPFAFYIRPRPSTQQFREQSSTATLRPRNSQSTMRVRSQPSQINMRDTVNQGQGLRHQSSRVLRARPSQQRLHNQASNRTLRASDTTPLLPQNNPPSSPTARSGANAPSGLSADERSRRAQDYITRRSEELRMQESTTSASNNPFHAVRRQAAPARETINAGISPTSSRPSSSRDGAPIPVSNLGSSATSPGIGQQGILSPPLRPVGASPNLQRRRSSRNIGTPPGAFASPQSNAQYGFARQRTGFTPVNGGIGAPPNSAGRRMSTVPSATEAGQY